MNKSVLDLAKDQVMFDIEALDGVQEKVEDLPEYRVYRYKGNFIYCFVKQGISHYIPGDLSSAVPREEHTDGGEIVFYVSKQTELVEGIYESFSGNSFGTIPKRKKLFGIF